jgi:ribonuclease P protein component
MAVAERSFKFLKRERISHPQEFRRVMTSGKKIPSRNFILFMKENQNQFHRLGIVVSKEVGPANYRNRIKRLFREFFRLNKNQIMGSYDFVIRVKKGCSLRAYAETEEEMRKLSL